MGQNEIHGIRTKWVGWVMTRMQQNKRVGMGPVRSGWDAMVWGGTGWDWD